MRRTFRTTQEAWEFQRTHPEYADSRLVSVVGGWELTTSTKSARQTVAQAQAALDAAWYARMRHGGDVKAANAAIVKAALALELARAQAEEDAAIMAHYERCHKAGVSGGD